MSWSITIIWWLGTLQSYSKWKYSNKQIGHQASRFVTNVSYTHICFFRKNINNATVYKLNGTPFSPTGWLWVGSLWYVFLSFIFDTEPESWYSKTWIQWSSLVRLVSVMGQCERCIAVNHLICAARHGGTNRHSTTVSDENKCRHQLFQQFNVCLCILFRHWNYLLGVF